MKISWTDTEDIAIELFERSPKLDPLTIKFTDLHQMVKALPNFEEKPGHPSNEKILEAIQMAWLEEYKHANS
jgi:FeS assembly protein IscX